MKKKVLAMLMASAMVFSLTACGGNAETVVEETQQEEIVDESSAKEETKQEETVVETSPKEEVVEETQEVEKVEEPEEGIAPVQPTSRIAHIDIENGRNVYDVTEALEYDSDGGYAVKGRIDFQDSSIDYELRFDNKGELTYAKRIQYDENNPDGAAMEANLVQGYSTCLTQTYSDEYGTYSHELYDWVDSGHTLLDSNGNLLGSSAENCLYGLYSFLIKNASIFGSGYAEGESTSCINTEGNKVFVSVLKEEEAFDVEQRKNVNKEICVSVEVISYGNNGLIESIEKYHKPREEGEMFTYANVETGELYDGVYYTYDSEGNVLECKTVSYTNEYENVVITYDYGEGTQKVNRTQTVSDSEDTTSDSSAASIEGLWRCRSENYPYDAISFDSYGTGNLYKGIDAYPLKYTFDGTKAYVNSDGQEFTFYVYLDENLMVEGESDASYDKVVKQ